MKISTTGLISLLPLLLVGCATVGTQSTSTSNSFATASGPEATTTTTDPKTTKMQRLSWEQRAKTLESIQSFRLTGKIAINTRRDSGTANVNWTQNGGQYRVSLTGPMGAGGMLLMGSPGGVSLRTANGKTLRAGSAEQLLAQHWGYRLPVSNLKYWVRGLPVRGVPYDGQYDAQNRLVRLRQNGWYVQFANYTNKGAFDLPERITISSNALNTKIVVYQWSI